MNRLKHFIIGILPVCFLLSSLGAGATHLMGSDLTYRCSNDTFYFTLKVYRDCSSPVLIGTTGQLLNVVGGTQNFTVPLTHVVTKDITPLCSTAVSRCASTSGTFGFQEYVFRGVVFFGTPLRASICDWRVSWSLAARNSTITSGQADQNFFTFTRFNRCLAPCNTSPFFTDAPVSLLCGNQAQYINMSAIDTTDSPRDSISYHMDTAWQSATTPCSYSTGLSPFYPLNTIGGIFRLDSISGTLQMIPIPNQIAVLVIAVKEWRKIAGVYQLISVIRRDIQVNVTVCGSGRNSPILPVMSMREICPGQTLDFWIPVNELDAGNTVTLTWSGNISGASFTSVGSPVPTGRFVWTPTNAQASPTPYYFSVLARDNSCPFNLYSTRTYYVKVKSQPFATASPTGPITLVPGNTTTLTATTPQLGYTYQWLKDNTPIPGANSSTYTANSNGQFSVIINNVENCPDTSNAVRVDYTTGINSFPYYETFESSDGGWVATGSNSTWIRSAFTMGKTNLLSAANGSFAWFTNAFGNYNNNELSYLTSPVFDMSSAFGSTNPVISFLSKRKLATGDVFWIEYNDGGTWTRLGTSGQGTNWYNSTAPQSWSGTSLNWYVSSFIIPLNSIVNKGAVQFRFVFSTNASGQDEGVIIDDIHIHSQEPIWTAATSVTNIVQRSTGTNQWLHFNSGTGRILSVKDNGFYLDTIRVNCYRNTGAVRSVNAGGVQFYLDRNWVIRTKNAPAIPITVRLYLTHQEFNALDVADPIINSIKRMGISKYSGANEDGSLANNVTPASFTFIPHTSISSVIPYSGGYILEFNVTSFSEFWVNSGTNSASIPLPVEWLSFSAKRNGKDALVEWSTAWEKNNNRFEIERWRESKEDAFRYLDEVPGKGSVVAVSQYKYIDIAPVETGRVYYRLKQVDHNGAFDYSDVQLVDFDETTEAALSAQPNPLTSVTQVQINLTTSQRVTFTVHDANGTLLYDKHLSLDKGNTALDLDLGGRSAGIYLLRVSGANWTRTLKLVKQ